MWGTWRMTVNEVYRLLETFGISALLARIIGGAQGARVPQYLRNLRVSVVPADDAGSRDWVKQPSSGEMSRTEMKV